MEKFTEQLRSLSKRVERTQQNILTEEATKTSIIMPFFQILGYDVFNPEEFIPEFNADVGIKRGEKVDFAIMQNNEPVILVEAKSINEKLKKHGTQLYRYFSVTPAKFAILTNGIQYLFYTDLEEQNKMDATPFFTFNLFELRTAKINELFKFHKTHFELENILTAASELKYTGALKEYIAAQFEEPSEEFTSFLVSHVYGGKKTKAVIEKFEPLVKKSLKEFANDIASDKLKAALDTTNAEAEVAATETTKTINEKPEIVTTQEELNAHNIIQQLLRYTCSMDRVNYRDTVHYLNILLDDNIRKWICRLYLNGTNKQVEFNDEEHTKYQFETVQDLNMYRGKFVEVAKRFL